MPGNDKIPRNILQDWTILIVDDEPDSLEVASRVLRYYGADVHVATNGLEGYVMAKNLKNELKFVLCDLSMPVLDGWGLLYELSNDTATAHIPIIALTAHAMSGDRERAMAAGFHNYLIKPFTPKKLMRDLLVLLDNIPELAIQLNQ